ncbi:MAG: VWA domain-containing protein, partial [Thermodesulfobacteriota bacterium]|nr:VWA domain-containing protein [Thermodesulfobacteriota bacterium]
MRICFKLTTMIFLIIFLTADQGNSAVKKRDLDLIVVLDDSGSMKKNDPEGLTKDAAKIIVDKVDMNDRMALVSFGTKSTLLSGLIQISNENIKKWFKSMIENLPQKDMYTNITSAIERSLYELKHNGRKDALQSIILLTDGKLDIPGGEAKRTESMNFLKTSIINDYKDLGILIYSIAFTEESDFSLMQFLAQSTGGEYYRAYTTSDLKDSFDAIYNDLVKKQTIELEETMPEPKVEKQEKLPPLITPELPEKKGISVITIIFFVGTLVLIVSAFLLVIRTKRKPLSEDEILKSSLPESKEPVSPQPERLEEEKDTYKTMIRFTSAQENFYLEPDVKIEGVNNIFLKKRITRVGRKGDNDIVLPHSFIS